jgi:hypothetical protein
MGPKPAGNGCWQPWKHASIDGGLRGLGIDYETGSGLDRFAYDATT